MENNEHVAGTVSQPKTRTASDRKILIVTRDGVNEFITKGEATKFLNEVGTTAVIGMYTGAKPASFKTKITL